MSFIRLAMTASLITAIALPVAAGNVSFDLPRLTFPASDTPSQGTANPTILILPK